MAPHELRLSEGANIFEIPGLEEVTTPLEAQRVGRAVLVASQIFGTPELVEGGDPNKVDFAFRLDTLPCGPVSWSGEPIVATFESAFDMPFYNADARYRADPEKMYIAKILLAIAANNILTEAKQMGFPSGWGVGTKDARMDVSARARAYVRALTRELDREFRDVDLRNIGRCIDDLESKGHFVEGYRDDADLV